MRIQLSIDDPTAASRSFRDFVVDRRRRLLIDVARRALAQIIERTPVETGRLRAAWIEALADLGGGSPPGSSAGNGDGTARVREAASETEIEIENVVPYARAVEYGTRDRAGGHIIHRALQEAASEMRTGR